MAQKTKDEYAEDVADLFDLVREIETEYPQTAEKQLKVLERGLELLYAELMRGHAERCKRARRRQREKAEEAAWAALNQPLPL